MSLFGLSSGAVADPPAATYSFTILEVPGATETSPTSINNDGQVTGTYRLDGSHGFVWSNGAFTTLDVPGATFTSATSINDSGQIAGLFRDASDQTHGFVYSNGAFTTFDLPGNDSSFSNSDEIMSINDSGQVAGSYRDSSGPVYEHGFVYSNSKFTTLDMPGVIATYVYSINDSGQVTGHSWTHGFIATPMVTDIPTLSQWALLLGGGLLIGMALLAQVRRIRALRG